MTMLMILMMMMMMVMVMVMIVVMIIMISPGKPWPLMRLWSEGGKLLGMIEPDQVVK